MEKNPAGYLSATEIPLSRLYLGMAALFFTAAVIWVYTLMRHRYSVTPGKVPRGLPAGRPCSGVRLLSAKCQQEGRRL